MIGLKQNSKHKSHQSSFVEPYFYRKCSNNLNLRQLSLFKVINTTVRQPFKVRQVSKAEQQRKSMSTRGLSIDQIKTRIKEYLGSNGDTEVVQFFGNDFLNENPQQRSMQQHFRVSMFKTNARKKINLKILQELNPERYQPSTKQFFIKEACINRRMLIPKQTEGQFVTNKHGVKSRLADHKHEKRKRIKYSVLEQNRQDKSSQLKKIQTTSRPTTPKGWDSLMQPWRKWEENQNLQEHSLF